MWKVRSCGSKLFQETTSWSNGSGKSRERKFQAGDKVLLLLPTDGNKLLMQWKGPFEVLECRNDNNYRIQLEGRVKMFHANMLKKYVERKGTGEEVEVVGAAVVEDGHYLEEGEITEFVSERKETYEKMFMLILILVQNRRKRS